MNWRTKEVLRGMYSEALQKAQAELTQLRPSTGKLGNGRHGSPVGSKPSEITRLEAKIAELRAVLLQLA